MAKPPKRPSFALLPSALLLALGAHLDACSEAAPLGEPPAAAGEERAPDDVRPGPVPADVFHPDRERSAEPRRGGTVTVFVPTSVPMLALPLSNSTYARNVLNEVHELLVRRDWETWEYRGVLAKRWDTEDTLVLKSGERVFGKVGDGGESWRVTPVSAGHPLKEPRDVAKADVEAVERSTVYTFYLRDDVKWHDGHPFDVDDVILGWTIYGNPEVRCDSFRSSFQKILKADRVDDHTVRFHYDRQFFKTFDNFQSLIPLPSHLYDLRDPDHPDHDPDADQAALARAINENPHNAMWVGLGPYRITKADPALYEAERFPDYFDPENAGWVDHIRWRFIRGFETALEALKNGELDFSAWLSTDMYLGDGTSDEAFTKGFYKGTYPYGSVNFMPWNMRRPHLSDVRVRKALVHGFDMERYKRERGGGLGVIPTGAQAPFSPAYNDEIEPLAYDPEHATELLEEAGWYDRDGDGFVDRDGVRLSVEYLAIAGHSGEQDFTQRLKKSWEEIGVELRVTELDHPTIQKRLKERDFDICSAAWSFPFESNQEQLWHSENDQPGRGNYPGVRDPKVDALLEAGEREVDTEKRYAIWKELQRYLYEEIHPYFYKVTPPRRFAMSKRIRGFQTFGLVPGYSIRRWFFAD